MNVCGYEINIIFLKRTNLEPPWLQEAVFDDIVYELDTSRNIAIRNSEKNNSKKLQRSISLAVSLISLKECVKLDVLVTKYKVCICMWFLEY